MLAVVVLAVSIGEANAQDGHPPAKPIEGPAIKFTKQKIIKLKPTERPPPAETEPPQEGVPGRHDRNGANAAIPAPASPPSPATAATEPPATHPAMTPGVTEDGAVPPATEAAAEDMARPSTSGQGVTQYYGITEPGTSPPWAAEATTNPDYAAAPSVATSGSPADQQPIEACRDAIDAEVAEGKLTFKISSWSLARESYATLNAVAEIAKVCGDVLIEVGGHTDNIGKPASNKSVSELRAAAVVSYLTRAGVRASNLKAVGYGPDRPIAPNDTPAGRMKNRRVELLVSPR